MRARACVCLWTYVGASAGGCAQLYAAACFFVWVRQMNTKRAYIQPPNRGDTCDGGYTRTTSRSKPISERFGNMCVCDPEIVVQLSLRRHDARDSTQNVSVCVYVCECCEYVSAHVGVCVCFKWNVFFGRR